MPLWIWWTAQWPDEPAHLFASAMTAGTLLMAALFRSSTHGWDLVALGLAIAAAVCSSIALAIEANARKRMNDALNDRHPVQQE